MANVVDYCLLYGTGTDKSPFLACPVLIGNVPINKAMRITVAIGRLPRPTGRLYSTKED